jgi:fructoselysine-6-P-deglycase FrlB-like protein
MCSIGVLLVDATALPAFDDAAEAAAHPGWDVERELASQPGTWARAGALVPELRTLLPAGRVAFAGCGTSFFMARSLAVLWEAAGLGQADAFCASEMAPRADYSTVVVICRSGTTTEVVGLLERLPGCRTLALVGSAPGPVSEAATHTLVLDFADERSVVQTRFATSVVALFRALTGDDVTALAGRAAAALERPAPEFPGAHRFVFLGTGAAAGLADEAALKMREASLTMTESYPAMEYRHGPIALAEPGVVVWFLGAPPAGLADEVRRTGATVVDDGEDPLIGLVQVQRVAVPPAPQPRRPPHGLTARTDRTD